MSKRTPDEIITSINDLLDDLLEDKSDPVWDGVWAGIWEIIEDLLHSVQLAEKEMLKGFLRRDAQQHEEPPDIHGTVRDYVVNHSGDD